MVFSQPTIFALHNFPSKYNSPVHYCAYYFFTPSRRNRVKLTFLYLDIMAADCGTDRIDIYDGLSLWSLSKQICNGNKVVEFISTQRNIKMIYTGNSVGKYRGFHAKVTFL